jgi:glucose dehydrogenase
VLSAHSQTAVNGREIFSASCARCHGLDARGGEYGPNITQLNVQLDLAAIVKAGVKGMPAFSGSLNDEEITAVVKYVRSLAPMAAGKTIQSANVVVNVKLADLLAVPVGANWVSYNGDYTGRRYSSLSRITTVNVDQLRAQWIFHAANSNLLECTPVVVDGIMFVTAANDVYAL